VPQMSEITRSHKNNVNANNNITNSMKQSKSSNTKHNYDQYKLSNTKQTTNTSSNKNTKDNKAKAYKLYLILHKKLAQIKNDILNDKQISPTPLIKYIPAMVKYTQLNNVLLLRALSDKRYGSWFESHSVNVSIYAIKIGLGMEYNKEKLYSLTFSALLHDVGMVKVPKEIKSKDGKLSNSEREAIEQHPQYGVNIISPLKAEYPFLYKVVQQEHEKYNGEGYPNGLEGKEIFEFARIIMICDIFEALNHSRSYRKHFKNTEAYHQLLKYEGKEIDPDILKIFMNEFTMFPVGSKVILNSGEVAQVTSVNKARPARPKIKVIKDSEGNKVDDPYIIDLEKEPLMRISESIY